MQHSILSTEQPRSAPSICQPALTSIGKGDRWEVSCPCQWWTRGTRIECRTAADIHAGIVREPIITPRATDMQRAAAKAENVHRDAADRRARTAYQKRIRDRGYRPPRDTRIAFIVEAIEQADGATALEPDLGLPPILAMSRQRA